jgi:polyisoprenoid-binding protein YceI
MRSRIHTGRIRKIGGSFGLGCLLLFSPLSQAGKDIPAAVTVTLNPQKTSVEWTLSAVLHTVHGNFAVNSGVIHLNPENGTADGLIVIDAKSGESGDQARDEKMQKNVLESDRYPEITFTPTHFSGDLNPAANEQITVKGTFSLHGENHPLELQVRVLSRTNDTLKFTAQFVVPYVQWGLKDPSTFVLHVGKTVAIDVNGVASVAP